MNSVQKCLLSFFYSCKTESVKTQIVMQTGCAYTLNITIKIKDIFMLFGVWVFCGSLCVFAFVACSVSPPPQQEEEDEHDVEVDGEGSVDVFLRIQAVAHRPHHQLTVNQEKLRRKRRRRRVRDILTRHRRRTIHDGWVSFSLNKCVHPVWVLFVRHPFRWLLSHVVFFTSEYTRAPRQP